MQGAVVWMTGLPASGKSTLAAAAAEKLRAREVACCILDSDEIRAALQPPPGYDDEARERFYATLGQLAALLARQGLVVLIAATAHRRRYRDDARRIAPRFVEVYVQTPREECEHRDVKGLYEAARRGDVETLPGVGADYEPPERPDVRAEGGSDERAIEAILRALQVIPSDGTGLARL